MKSTELRLNNWVLFVPQGKKANPPRWVQVAKIKASEVTVIDKGLILVLFHDASLQAIPLSPEILEKAGWKKNKHLYFYKGLRYDTKHFYLTILQYCSKAGESQPDICGKDSLGQRIELTTLHQLQNLYFALTQTELTIQL